MTDIIAAKIKSAEKSIILIVDDEPNVLEVVKEMLEHENLEILAAYSVAEAKSIIYRQNINIVLTDMLLGDGSGVDLLKEAKKIHPESQVILMTGRPSIQTAISVLKLGAYDYLIKPFGIDTLKMTIRRAEEKIKLERENIHLRELMSFYQICEAMGSTIELDDLLRFILDAAMKEFEADFASLHFMSSDEEKIELKATAGLENDKLKHLTIDHCRNISIESVTKNEPIIFNDPDMDYTWGGQSIKSSICQLLMAKGKVLGTLAVVRISNPHPFTQGQLIGLSLLASKAAAALENSNLYSNLKTAYVETVESLANAIEARDSYTRGHTERVYMMACSIAEELGWTVEMLGDLKMGALLHDIGKIGVPDAILNKTASLTPEEFSIMKMHPEAGARIVNSISFLKPALPYILYHHERHDGNGYPYGLAGENIPMPGRLLAVVDTLDAITSDRPYRNGRSLEIAIKEISRNSGTQFHPLVAQACIESFKKGKLNFLFGSESA